MSAYYAVAIGRIPGIYRTWRECETQISGYSGARFKKFSTVTDANEFINIEPVKKPKPQILRPILKQSKGCVIFVDGSCANNGKPNAKAAWAVVFPFHPEYTTSGLVPDPQTNNRAEYMAVIKAHEIAKKFTKEPLIIYSDSKLLVQTINEWVVTWKNNGWNKSGGPFRSLIWILFKNWMKLGTTTCQFIIFRHILEARTFIQFGMPKQINWLIQSHMKNKNTQN